MSIPTFHSLRSMNEEDNSTHIINNSIEILKQDSPRTAYSKLRNAKEQATFNLMMRMDPSSISKIRQEFYSRNDEVPLTDFIYIMYKHLIELAEPDSVLTVKQQDTRSFVSDMHELFKEVDVNGDGMMEWEEFTKFTVEKASLLNQKFVMATIPEYVESTNSLDSSIKTFRRNDICKMLPMPSIGCFSVLEEHSKDIAIYYSLNGRHLTNISTESVPLAIDFAKETSTLYASCSNLQINMYQQLPNKRFQYQGSLPTIDTQMSLAWMPTNEVLYSGSESGIINCWKPSEKSLITSMNGHNDICMKLLALDQLDNLVSASMDTTIGVWDTYTNSILSKLKGHKKGVFDMSYNPDYRLLFSCGFDHDAFVWSPFVSSLVFKLKGHHASLVGCHSVENSPEVLTADEDGVFKLWDIRTFQCVQTFFHNSAVDSNEPAEHLSCFFHQNIPTSHRGDEGGEARIYAGSRRVRSFDQKRIVHQRTTDFTNVIWMSINCESFLIFTASDRNIIVWDLLLGSKILLHNNICGEEISACCVDNRQRKIIIGDVHGRINVYNPLTGAFMKSCPNDIDSIVTTLIYLGDNRRFIAGYSCSIIRIYDESKLDDCFTIRTFEIRMFQSELTLLSYCNLDRSIMTSSSTGQTLKVWDFDTGKLDLDIEVCATTETVISITVLDPFPLILTSDSSGNLIIWGSRGCKWKGNQITSFVNINPYTAELEEQKRPDANGIPPQRILPRLDFMRQETSIINSSEDEHITRHSIVDDFHLCEQKWGKVSAATTLSWDQIKYELYTGDELGYLRKWSIKHIIEELGGMAMVHGHKSISKDKPPSRVIKRGARTSNAVTPSTHTSQVSYIMGKFGNIAESSVKFCWALQGHDETIISCVVSQDGILTSSTDSLVKMWTFDGLLIGILLHNVLSGVKSLNWNIHVDLNAVRIKEEQELDELMIQLEKIKEEKGYIQEENVSEIDSAVAEAKFSRSTLRKRIELSSKILGLDFTAELQQIQNQKYNNNNNNPGIIFNNGIIDEMSDFGCNSSITSLKSSYDDDNHSIGSSSITSKNTKDAIDESKNIFRHTDLIIKKKPCSVAQLRRSEQTMQKMAEKYLEKGIKLPVLKSAPKSSDFLLSEMGINITKNSSRSKNKYYKQSNNNGNNGNNGNDNNLDNSEHGSSSKLLTVFDDEIHRQSSIAKKCSKYSTYKNLENSLVSSLNKSEQRNKMITEKIQQRQAKLLNKFLFEKNKLNNDINSTESLVQKNESQEINQKESSRPDIRELRGYSQSDSNIEDV